MDQSNKSKKIRINFWAGPGCGKSTVAAQIFSAIKSLGYNAELCQEYVKSWAYENRKIQSFDQVYIFAKQQRLEDRVLRSGVDIVVSDSPLLMQCVYAKKYNTPCYQQLTQIALEFDNHFPSFNILLERKKEYYKEIGRFQNLEQAIEIDKEIKDFMIDNNVKFTEVSPDSDILSLVIKALNGK